MTTRRSRSVALACLVLACASPGEAQPAARAGEKSKSRPAGAAGERPAWRSLFDGKALDGWKSAGYANAGKVTVKDGAIVLEKGRQMTGVVYGRGDFPRMDYEVSFDGKRIAGSDFFCTTTFPVASSYCSFVVGGWGGNVVGLSSINGADASENETGTSKEFRQDQWYPVRVRVTRGKIEAWIGDSKMVDLATGDRRISIRVECAACRPFGIATWDTTGAVRNIRVRPLTEAEKKGSGGKGNGSD